MRLHAICASTGRARSGASARVMPTRTPRARPFGSQNRSPGKTKGRPECSGAAAFLLRERERSSADGFLVLPFADLNLHLTRAPSLVDRDFDLQNAVSQPAAKFVDVEPARKRDSGVELAVGQLRPGVAIPIFGHLALAL